MMREKRNSVRRKILLRYLFSPILLCTLISAATLVLGWRYVDSPLQDSAFRVMSAGVGGQWLAGLLVVSGFSVILGRRIRERDEAETALKQANERLDQRIRERTFELEAAKRCLELEILERQKAQEQQAAVIAELEQALEKVNTLRGLLPICSLCKNIRTDSGYWEKIERYIQNHSEARFTHGICPDCEKQLYPLPNKENEKGV